MSKPIVMKDPMGLASLPGSGCGFGGSVGYLACGDPMIFPVPAEPLEPGKVGDCWTGSHPDCVGPCSSPGTFGQAFCDGDDSYCCVCDSSIYQAMAPVPHDVFNKMRECVARHEECHKDDCDSDIVEDDFLEEAICHAASIPCMADALAMCPRGPEGARCRAKVIQMILRTVDGGLFYLEEYLRDTGKYEWLIPLFPKIQPQPIPPEWEKLL